MLNITIRTLTGKSIPFKVSPDWPTSRLEEMLRDHMEVKEGWPRNSYPVRFIFRGKIMGDTTETPPKFKKGTSSENLSFGSGPRRIRILIRGEKLFLNFRFSGETSLEGLPGKILNTCSPYLLKPENIHSFKVKSLWIGGKDIEDYLSQLIRKNGAMDHVYALRDIWSVEIVQENRTDRLGDFGIEEGCMIHFVYSMGRNYFLDRKYPLEGVHIGKKNYEPGMNVVGECENTKCSKLGVESILSYGRYQEWYDHRLHTSFLCCGVCKKKISPREYIFCNSHFRLSGFITNEDGKVERYQTNWESVFGEGKVKRLEIPENLSKRFCISTRFYDKSPSLWCPICHKVVSKREEKKGKGCDHLVDELCMKKWNMKCHICDIDKLLPLEGQDFEDIDKKERFDYVKDSCFEGEVGMDGILEIVFIGGNTSLKASKCFFQT